ncbi:hypothetical protein J6590_044842 [Homalodisca vitripennis]|nr:hypothetical protein J6590_044842 [Homalodisca vitripennis]
MAAVQRWLNVITVVDISGVTFTSAYSQRSHSTSVESTKVPQYHECGEHKSPTVPRVWRAQGWSWIEFGTDPGRPVTGKPPINNLLPVQHIWSSRLGSFSYESLPNNDGFLKTRDIILSIRRCKLSMTLFSLINFRYKGIGVAL